MPPLATAVRRLERRAAQAPALIEPAVKAIDAALTALDEARMHLEHALRVAEYDPHELERIEERLFALRAASRKYNVPVDDLAALARRYDGDLALIDAGAERLAALERDMQEAAARYQRNGAKRCRPNAGAPARRSTRRSMPSSSRSSSSARNSRPRSRATGEGPDGLDRVEFWVRTNPGTRPGPLMKVASGGELSRFLLALKVVLADRGSAPTLVFDEIDTGVGGAIADAIGVRLARLAVRRPGDRGHPRAAGGGARRPALSHHQGCARQGQARRDPRRRDCKPIAAARRSPACSPAPRSPPKPAPPPSG